MDPVLNIPNLFDTDDQISLLARTVRKIQMERHLARLSQVANGDTLENIYRDGTTYEAFFDQCQAGLERLRAYWPDQWKALLQRVESRDLVDAMDGNQNGSEGS